MVDLLSAIREHQGGRRQKVGLVRLNSQHRLSPFPSQWAARPLAAERLLVEKSLSNEKMRKTPIQSSQCSNLQKNAVLVIF